MFEILRGLPPYGAPAEPFTATGQGAHREGFVVRVLASNGTTWAGNFQRGFGSLSDVRPHPDARRLIVIAAGQGYVVDPDNRTYRQYLDSQIREVLVVPELPALVMSNGFDLEAIGPAGLLWKTPRLSWDGFQAIEMRFPELRGEAWDAVDDSWRMFTVDLPTGHFAGGAFGKL